MSSTKGKLQDLLLLILAILFTLTCFLVLDFSTTFLFGSATRPLTLEEKPYLAKANGWYELKKSFAGQGEFGGRKFAVHTDKYGFRKKPGAIELSQYDVIFLGDSFTYGITGPWEETIVGMYADDSGRNVINTGVGSYSPTAYLYQYNRALSENLLPDGHIVVIALDISDVQDEAGYWIDGPRHPRKRDAELAYKDEQKKLAKSSTGKTFIRDSFPYTTKIYRYIRYEFLARPEDKASPVDLTELVRSAFTHVDWPELDQTVPYEEPSGFAPLGVANGLRKLETKLSEIVRIAAQHRARVYFLIYPWPAQIERADKFSWSNYVAGLCERFACRGVIDTIPRFRELAKQDKSWLERYYFDWDLHFNKTGNRVVANALLEGLPSD